jgi:hypothetical protein
MLNRALATKLKASAAHNSHHEFMKKCFLGLIAAAAVFLPLSQNAQADGGYYHHYYGYHDACCHEGYFYVGQCHSGCWYPDAHKGSLTHTVFHGRDRHYDTMPDFTSRGDSSDNLSPLGENLERFPWKYKIAATVFWVGEQATENNPIPNTESAWDSSWVAHYGGEDDPTRRVNFIPAGFLPKQNPFYVALPYNDVDDHHTKLEASKVIPWFNDSFVKDGQSVCKDRWVTIRHEKRTCYAQWEDVGPFQIDHWQYVFGNERPRANINQDAGIDVSPAVRDYLGMSGMDVCDWKFVNVYEVPNGPWTLYGRKCCNFASTP